MSNQAVVEPRKAADLRVLVADSERIVRNVVARALKREGFRCIGAGDGQEAFQRAAEGPFDAIVVDLVMPRLHGHALLAKLLELPYRPVLVVLTGLQSPELVKELIALGVDYYECKPTRMDLFAARVRALVDKRAANETVPAGVVTDPVELEWS